MSDVPNEITRLLQAWKDGDRAAENQLFSLVLPKLKSLAHRIMGGERAHHTLQPSELVDQVYLRLVAGKNQDWASRQHFYCISARIMRRYLIDYARARPDASFIAADELENVLSVNEARLDEAIIIDRLLGELGDVRPEWVQIIELRFFLGLTNDEAAEVLGAHPKHVARAWRDARSWLFDRMNTAVAREAST